MLSHAQINQYREAGFFVLKHFIDPDEVEMLRKELNQMIARAPVHRDANQDPYGQTVDYPNDFAFTNLDPEGQQQVLNRIGSPLARSEVMLRAYGNPKLLAVVETLYGSNFVPFAESIVIKLPKNGPPFAWHQDGEFKTGWQTERGVNFGIYLYPSTEENGCLYVIPKSRNWGKSNIRSMINAHGKHLSGAIPVPAEPGDVIVHSRNLIHGSFANESADLRITVYFGYHMRTAVEGVFEPDHIKKRVKAIPLAVHLRTESGSFPREKPYLYAGYQIDRDLTPSEQQSILRAPPLAI